PLTTAIHTLSLHDALPIFDDSIRAADLFGPNARNFSLVNRSMIPAARGSSGPTTVRSTRFSFAKLTRAFKSLTGIVTFSATSPVDRKSTRLNSSHQIISYA